MKRLRVREVRTFSQDRKASREQTTSYGSGLHPIYYTAHSWAHGPRHKDLLPSPEQMHPHSSLMAEH